MGSWKNKFQFGRVPLRVCVCACMFLRVWVCVEGDLPIDVICHTVMDSTIGHSTHTHAVLTIDEYRYAAHLSIYGMARPTCN